jgi:hypothetical protein
MDMIPRTEFSDNESGLTSKNSEDAVNCERRGDSRGGVAQPGNPSSDSDVARNDCEASVSRVSTNSLQPNKFNPNRMGHRNFEHLRATQLRDGINQCPILCRRVGNHLEIIDGEKRWRAALEAGLELVVVKIIEADDYVARQRCLEANRKGCIDKLAYARMIREMRQLAPEKSNKAFGADLGGLCEGMIRNWLKFADFPDQHPEIAETEITKMSFQQINDYGKPKGRVMVSGGGGEFRVAVNCPAKGLAKVDRLIAKVSRQMVLDARLSDDFVRYELAMIMRLVALSMDGTAQRERVLGRHGTNAVLEWAEQVGWEVQCDAQVRGELNSEFLPTS